MVLEGPHRRAEELAAEAEISGREGRVSQARKLYRLAAESERNALVMADRKKKRTFGALAVSVVSLYYKAREYAHAERLVHQLLQEGELSEFAVLHEFAVLQLHELLTAIWTEQSKKSSPSPVSKLGSIKPHYYPESDSLYLELTERPSVDSREVAPGVVLDFDAEEHVVGIDIDHASEITGLTLSEGSESHLSKVPALGKSARKRNADKRSRP